MALFPNVQGDYTFGGKTHTNLVVSEGAAPAEKWIVDKDEKFKFNYAFGPEGNQGVVLAKGKIVELGAAQHDYETNRMVSTIKTATTGSSRAVGVNHHNIYERKRDRFSGNNQPNPVVITRSYIEVPLFEAADAGTASQAANAMGYGAAYGVSNTIQPGDFVKVGENGNFVKLDPSAGDTAFQIVGQALAVERELPPAGFLQYYMDMKIDEIEAFFKAKSHAPSPGNNNTDAGAYPFGYPYQNKGWKADFEKLLNPTINKGIPFLTDGYFAAKQVLTGKALSDKYDATTNASGAIENVAVSGQVTVTGDEAVVAADSRNNALFIKLRNQIDRVEADKLEVRYTQLDTDGVTPVAKSFTGQDLHIDFTNNTVVVYLEAGQTYTDIVLDIPSVVDPIAGMPTEWDHQGSVGAVRILLQR
jgi:hypothetical protein